MINRSGIDWLHSRSLHSRSPRGGHYWRLVSGGVGCACDGFIFCGDWAEQILFHSDFFSVARALRRASMKSSSLDRWFFPRLINEEALQKDFLHRWSPHGDLGSVGVCMVLARLKNGEVVADWIPYRPDVLCGVESIWMISVTIHFFGLRANVSGGIRQVWGSRSHNPRWAAARPHLATQRQRSPCVRHFGLPFWIIHRGPHEMLVDDAAKSRRDPRGAREAFSIVLSQGAACCSPW